MADYKASTFFSKASNFFSQKEAGSYADTEISSPNSSIEDLNYADNEAPSKLEKLKFWKKKDTIINAINNKIHGVQERTEMYKYGMMMLAAGVFVIFLSFCFIPMIMVVPQKFCALFSVGSILCMTSLGMMIGGQKLFKKLFAKNMVLYSSVYFLSLVVGKDRF
jgi:hypothetical protein